MNAEAKVAGFDLGADPASDDASRRARIFEAGAFIAIWMGIGALFDMAPDTYLLFGVPYVAAFQLWVRRRPLSELWVRRGPALSWAAIPLRIAAGLAIAPAAYLLFDLANGREADFLLYDACAIAGAFAAAYAFGALGQHGWRQLALCCGLGAGIMALLTIDVALHHSAAVHPTAGRASSGLVFGVESFLLYLPAVFVIEEVVFRGALDSHVQHRGERSGVLSALYVSVLWGVWHHQIVPHVALWKLLFAQIIFGLILSFFWRVSGNLAVTGTAHALSDAFRNALGQV